MNTQRKLQKIRPHIAKNPEFDKFVTIGRIKLPVDEDEFLYFDIAFRVPKNIMDENSKLVEFILNDVTQIIQVENDKNDIKFKSVLLAKIAHEFKNPINTINAICVKLNNEIMKNPEMMLALQKLQNVNDEKINNLNFIASLCDYLLFLIEDLNTFVKIGLSKKDKKTDRKDNSSSEQVSEKSFNKKMTTLNLIHLIDFCYNLFFIKQAYDKSKPFLKITKTLASDLPEQFYTNEIKLKQVLINLLSNSYKFTVSGLINIDVRLVKYDNKSNIKFSIIDTGTGLDKTEMKNIFKPFATVDRNQVHNNHGSGLGLCIVTDILELFDSKVNVVSEVGKGSTFSFELENKFPKQHLYGEILENDKEDENFTIMTKLNTELKVGESNFLFE